MTTGDQMDRPPYKQDGVSYAPYERLFTEKGDFAALEAAKAWLKSNGYSYGSWARGMPCGVLKGDALIAKWKNMTAREIAQLDGQMYGDGRNGPIKVTLKVAP